VNNPGKKFAVEADACRSFPRESHPRRGAGSASWRAIRRLRLRGLRLPLNSPYLRFTALASTTR
jgi:hypothetical protein